MIRHNLDVIKGVVYEIALYSYLGLDQNSIFQNSSVDS
jgi:hypothetical protein